MQAFAAWGSVNRRRRPLRRRERFPVRVIRRRRWTFPSGNDRRPDLFAHDRRPHHSEPMGRISRQPPGHLWTHDADWKTHAPFFSRQHDGPQRQRRAPYQPGPTAKVCRGAPFPTDGTGLKPFWNDKIPDIFPQAWTFKGRTAREPEGPTASIPHFLLSIPRRI